MPRERRNIATIHWASDIELTYCDESPYFESFARPNTVTVIQYSNLDNSNEGVNKSHEE